MKVERAVYMKNIALDLVLQSRDGATHSLMSEEPRRFERLLDEAAAALQATEPQLPPRPATFELIPARIGLAVEAPAPLLHATRELTSLDFAIAHQVLADEDYATYYRNRPAGRECILDNSFHELGVAVSIDQLLQAATLIQPDYIVCPDQLDVAERTIASFAQLKTMQLPWKIAIVLSGETEEDRRRLLERCGEADLLCLPYDRPRYLWYLQLFPHWQRVHLLGVSELSELLAWMPFTAGIHLTVDTGKPVKYGLLGKSLSSLRSYRRSGLASRDLLNTVNFSAAAEQRVLENVQFLSSVLR